MTDATISRRSLLAGLGALGLGASANAQETSLKLDEDPIRTQNPDTATDLNKLFAAEETRSLRTHEEDLYVEHPAWKALEKKLTNPKFMQSVRMLKTDDGKEYPDFTQDNIEYLKAAIEACFRDCFGAKDPKIKSAIAFKGSKLDKGSVFRGRTFFITEKPVNDSAKSTVVYLAQSVKDFTKKLLPKVANDALDSIYRFARNHIYRNMFRYSKNGDVNNPSGWHAFSQNAIRIEVVQAKDGKAAYLRPRVNYNVQFTDDEMKDSKNKLFTFNFAAGHINMTNTALLDENKDAKYHRYRAHDPAGPYKTAQGKDRKLVTNMHEIMPVDKVDIFNF